MSWVVDEFANSDLKDKRLNKRLVSMMSNFSKKPSCSILESTNTWKESLAAYRFFANDKVTHEGVLAPHIKATTKRISHLPVVLVAHDTTSINYSGHSKTSGLGTVGSRSSKGIGLQMHSSYAISDEGQCLGILHQNIWARENSSSKSSVDNAKISIELKESSKWIKSIEASTSALSDQKTKLIHLCDREGDIYEVFCKAKEIYTNFIIRCKSNRRINKKSRASEDGSLLRDSLHSEAVLGIHHLEIAQRKGPTRVAKCELKSLQYKVTMPRNKSSFDHKLEKFIILNAISLKEVGSKKESDHIDWTLITSFPTLDFESAILCVNRYCKRWQIEVFHKNLKTGCRVESCGLDSAKKLEVFIALMSVIAWRMHWMTWLSRITPLMPASVAFSDEEIKILNLKINKKLDLNLNLEQAIICVAKLGGYIGRKNDPKPGTIVLIRGWMRLHHTVEDLNVLKLMYNC